MDEQKDVMCALCNTNIAQVTIQLVPSARVTPEMQNHSNGAIKVCRYCEKVMVFNPTSLCTLTSTNNDDVIVEFLRELIRSSWPYPRVPSYQDLAHACNLAGLRTANSHRWTYHNIRQKLTALGFDRQTEFNELWRSKGPRMDVQEAIQTAVLNGLYNEMNDVHPSIETSPVSPFGDDGIKIG